MRKGVIYKLTFPDGETYIGRTTNLPKRLTCYKRLDKNNQHLLEAILNKYGYDACDLEIVEADIPECDLNKREIHWIEFYKTMLFKYPENNGLNICAGGAGAVGRKDKPETIELKREWLLNNPIHTYHREMSDEAKLRVSERSKGKKYRLGSTWTNSQRIKF